MTNSNKNKIFWKIATYVVIFSLSLLYTPAIFADTARLTSAKDTLSRLQRSGTGVLVAGYTESTNAVTNAFTFSTSTADISWDTGAISTTTISMINDGNLNASSTYTGEEVAAALEFALENTDSDADDDYIVTYNATGSADYLFSIMGSGGNTSDANIDWVTSSASSTFGYATGSSSIRGTSFEGSTVNFGVASSTGQFSLTIDGGTAEIVIIHAGDYTTSTIITELNAQISGAATASYTDSSNKFKIASDSTGAHSIIRVASVSNSDFLPVMKMIADAPFDGAQASGLVAANHTIVFTLTTAVAVSGKVVITLPSGFTLPSSLDYTDMDFNGGTYGEATLAAAAGSGGASAIGVGVSGQVITFTLNDTNALTAGETITLEIGTQATTGETGDIQIVNPATAGLYQITLETQSDGTNVTDNAYVGVYIIGDDSVVLTATVEPLLNFDLLGGTTIDFCSLEPNRYHKVGGDLPAHGSVLLAAITVDTNLDGETITIDTELYEFDDNASSSAGDLTTTTVALVDIVDNQGSYLTAAQVADNLHRAINNNSSRVRANVDAGVNTTVNLVAIANGSAGNSYTLSEQTTAATLTSDSGDTTFVDGYAAYKYKDNDSDWEDDTGNPAASNYCTDTGNSLRISTNAVSGYVITVQDTGFKSGSYEIDDWANTSDFGFGLRAKARSSVYGSSTTPIIAAYRHSDADAEPLTPTATTFVSNSNSVAQDIIAIEYMIRIGTSQEAGQYSDTVTYIATATY